MAELIGIILLSLAGGVATVALLLVCIYLLPERTTQAKHTLAERPGRSFLVGLVNLLFFGVLAALLGRGGQLLQLFSAAILLALLGLAVVGLAGLVRLLHGRIYPHSKGDVLTVTEGGKTAVLLIIAALAPVAGWFILAPLALVAGLGATITTLLRRPPAPENL